MTITSSEIKYYISGGTTNTNPALSIGGARSTVGGGEITSGVLNNVWSDIDATQAGAGSVKYRCIYVRNTNLEDTWTSPKIWLSSLTTSSDDEVDIGLGSSAVNGTEQSVANEDSAPTGGVTFSRPVSKATGLTLGSTLTAGQHKALWIRRTVLSGAGQITNNFYILTSEGDSPA
jgi:hypothetical protein